MVLVTDYLIVDAHEDLAWNIQVFKRDYRRSAAETRLLEAGSLAVEKNGDTLLGWPDYQRGRVAVVFGTLFASPTRRKTGDWDYPTYATANEAHAIYRWQLDAYQRLADEAPEQFCRLLSRADLQALLAHWQRSDLNEHPVGLVTLMEGAEGVRHPGELEEWWAGGVRIIGPAWAGTRFCGGTREPGPLTPEGYQLLEGMAQVGFSLDLSHMDEQAALQSLDVYPGPVIASHANVSALLKGAESNRHLSDRLLDGLLERGAVIGVVPFNHFLRVGWKEADGRAAVTLDAVVAQIDYICQRAGSAHQVGLGSDFDGGFGLGSVPSGVDTIADLQKLAPLLAEKGYTEDDIAAILGGNWLSHLQSTLPEVL